MKILFFGDSVTDADRNKTPAATPMNAMGQGYAALIDAKLGAEFPGQYTFCNRGIGGNRLSELYARLEQDVVLEKPDLVSIFAGINDSGFYSVWGLELDIARFKRVYHAMIQEIRSFLPDVKFMICEPVFYPAGSRKDDETHIGATMPSVRRAVREVAEEQKIPFVALQDRFTAQCEQGNPEYWLWDGIHPTLPGHQLIADEWISVFRQNF